MRLAAVMTAAIVTASALAQDSRADAARLHELIDRRIEELRAELHREIEAEFGRHTLSADALAAALAVTLRPVSGEFRELHRLGTDPAHRIESVRPGGRAEALRLSRGDVILAAEDVETFYPTVRLIRLNERLVLPMRGVLAAPAIETASQMVDRLWDKAVRDAMKGGFEEIHPRNPVSESQPRPK